MEDLREEMITAPKELQPISLRSLNPLDVEDGMNLEDKVFLLQEKEWEVVKASKNYTNSNHKSP